MTTAGQLATTTATTKPADVEPAALALSGITHRYGATEVLHDVALTIQPSELVALLGPSGSGKTTLLAIAGGLLTPSTGTVHLAGHDLYPATKPDPHTARRVAFILQGAATIGFLTVEDNLLARSVVLGRPVTAGDRQHARDLLRGLDLDDKANRYPSDLSGGERQRTCVAAALYTRAPLLLADEPTASLDRQRGRAVVELLADHTRAHHAAVIVATHDERALDLFDRVIRLEDGVLRPDGQGSRPMNANSLVCTSASSATGTRGP